MFYSISTKSIHQNDDHEIHKNCFQARTFKEMERQLLENYWKSFLACWDEVWVEIYTLLNFFKAFKLKI